MDGFHGAKLILQARSQAGLTQSQLAKSAGTSQAAVARYESGKASPSVATLSRLLHAAGFELQVSLKPTSRSNLSSQHAQALRLHRGAINQLAHNIGATNIRVFGSVARGESALESDIDLLVDYDITHGLMPIYELQENLTRLVGLPIQISPVDALKPQVLRSALRDAVPL